MKYSIDTYRLYQNEKMFSHTVRIHVRMKDEVDIAVLDKAVNTAMKRYPYFAVRVSLDDEGGYVLLPNDKKIVVMTTAKKTPRLGSKAVNEHLIYADCEGKDIYLNISHTMCGGKGFQPWVMTTIWEYVKEKYNVLPDAPEIWKPDSEVLPGETTEPTMEMLSEEEPIIKRKIKKSPILALDYLNGLINPFKRKPNYRVFVIDQADLIKVAKQNDSSVITFFFITFARALNRFFPKKFKTIVGEGAHNPRESMDIPDTHCDFLSHIYAVDKEQGIKNKRKYMAKHSLSTGDEAQHGSFILNYTGWMDWGEVAEYIDWYAYVIEGHCTVEVTALGDKIVFGLMQLVDTNKYALAFQEELNKLGVPCKIEGPFPKRLPRHELPHTAMP